MSREKQIEEMAKATMKHCEYANKMQISFLTSI